MQGFIAGCVDYYPSFFAPAEASALLRELSVGWHLTSAGVPSRFVVCLDVQPTPPQWISAITQIKAKLDATLQQRFNSVILNYYRDGRDHMGLHSDTEPELGDEPIIAGVSFGAERPFLLRSRTGEQRVLTLNHGSLVVMKGACQREWCHSIPVADTDEPRISLTFRSVSL